MAAAADLRLHPANGVALALEGERVSHVPRWPFGPNDEAGIAQLEELPIADVELVSAP